LPIGSGLYRKRNMLYVEIWHGGERVYQGTTRTSDIQAALRFKAAKLAEIITSQDTAIADLKKGVRIAELFDDYVAKIKSNEADAGEYANSREYETNSYKASSRINANLRPFFGKFKAEEISTDLLEEYRSKRRNAGAKVPTVNTEFRLLRAALRYGTKRTPRKVSPLHIPYFGEVINHKAEKKAKRTGTISLEQYSKIMEHAPDHMKPVFAAIYYSGIRSKEIKWVRREKAARSSGDRRVQVNFEEHEICLRAGETKDSDARVCGMNKHVEEILKSWEEQTAKEYPACPWFFHLQGAQLGNWKTAWNATLRRAGFREGGKNLLKFHDTRRTNITSLTKLGVEEKHVMNNSGHKTVAVSRGYDQSKISAKIVTQAQNKAMGFGDTEQSGEATTAAPDDVAARIERLCERFEKGMLTAEEFALLKAKILQIA